MTLSEIKAIVADGGGWDNIVNLVFDNAIHVQFGTQTSPDRCKESDFITIGGCDVYKESFLVRNKVTGRYDITLTNYHPLECLQSIVMGNAEDVDILQYNDMF